VRRTQRKKVARLQTIPPSAGEVFYLRCLLAHRAARTYTQLKTIDDITYDTFHEAATQLGLFSTENEGFLTMTEAVASFHTPAQLCFLFSCVILEGYPARTLWDYFCPQLSQDYQRATRDDDQGCNLALQSINALVRDSGRRLTDFGLPEPCVRSAEVMAELQVYAEQQHSLRERAVRSYRAMNAEQAYVFQMIVDAVETRTENPSTTTPPAFVEGKPGRGKTFVLDAVACAVRSQGLIVLIVGTSALAATLYDGGRTAHNLFQIPVNDVHVLSSNCTYYT
jgi:hypothetical protein